LCDKHQQSVTGADVEETTGNRPETVVIPSPLCESKAHNSSHCEWKSLGGMSHVMFVYKPSTYSVMWFFVSDSSRWTFFLNVNLFTAVSWISPVQDPLHNSDDGTTARCDHSNDVILEYNPRALSCECDRI